MPDLNLNEEGAMEEQTPSEEPSQPTEEQPQEEEAKSGMATKIVIIVVGVLIMGGVVFMLNKLGIVKLWGKKEPVVAQIEEPAAQEQLAVPPRDSTQQPTQKATKEEQKPAPTQQQAKQETKQAPAQQAPKKEAKAEPKVVKAEPPPKQESKPVQQAAEMKPVETPKIETPTVAKEEQKNQDPSKMLFKLKEPLDVPAYTRRTSSIAKAETPVREETRVAKKEEKPAQPKQEQPAETKKEAPAETKQVAAPKKEPGAQPKQETPAQPKQAAPKTGTANAGDMKGSYTVQVYAMREKENADEVTKRLAEAGYPAFVEAVDAKGVTWYAVRIGRYPSRMDAQKAGEGFALELRERYVIGKTNTQ